MTNLFVKINGYVGEFFLDFEHNFNSNGITIRSEVQQLVTDLNAKSGVQPAAQPSVLPVGSPGVIPPSPNPVQPPSFQAPPPIVPIQPPS